MTLLALTEAMSIARAYALRAKVELDTKQEMVGQGLANLAGAFFSSYPASGSFNRSGLKRRGGGANTSGCNLLRPVAGRVADVSRRPVQVPAARLHLGHPDHGGLDFD